jgi:predicted transcriptional regulator
MNKKDQKINIELDQEIAEGIYSNLAIINHSVSEFIVDFVSLMPGSPKAKVKSRIILSPQHAKRLKTALEDNINRFEKSNGKIKNDDQSNIPLNFGPTGEA